MPSVWLNQVPGPALFDEESQAEQVAEQGLIHRALELIRPEFTEHTWQAFWRTVVGEQPAGTVAQDLGMSPGAVRVAKCRVLQRLREALGDPVRRGGRREEAVMPIQLYAGQATFSGLRSENEDAVAVKRFGDWTLCVVADGVGGSGLGRVASMRVIEVVSEVLAEELAGPSVSGGARTDRATNRPSPADGTTRACLPRCGRQSARR